MKVTISVGGTWHAFYVAEQLYLRGRLEKVITGYPYFKLKKWKCEVPWEKIYSIPYSTFFNLLFRKLRLPSSKVTYLSCIIFDYLASFEIKKCDVLVGWPTFCLSSIQRAKSKRIITVIDVDHLSKTPCQMENTFSGTAYVNNSRNLVYQKIVSILGFKKLHKIYYILYYFL